MQSDLFTSPPQAAKHEVHMHVSVREVGIHTHACDFTGTGTGLGLIIRSYSEADNFKRLGLRASHIPTLTMPGEQPTYKYAYRNRIHRIYASPHSAREVPQT
ncbi:hypothetical protein A0H81_13011 [Grifola frondosa]|uniref:Uncharacterized protein n=1 Tax=Grifola frondosa TaxID=5627 RepID=A0A1C7LQV3_GRIFR|nr:hypothetical protein A0H81_13011 [Grifola frondosa]